MKISKLSVVPIYLAMAKAGTVYAGDVWDTFVPTDQTNGKTIPGIIQTVLNFAIGFAVVVCVAILIFAGYSYMTANGDENKITQATKSLTWAIIGLVVCFIAIILVKFVGGKLLGEGVVEGV